MVLNGLKCRVLTGSLTQSHLTFITKDWVLFANVFILDVRYYFEWCQEGALWCFVRLVYVYECLCLDRNQPPYDGEPATNLCCTLIFPLESPVWTVDTAHIY